MPRGVGGKGIVNRQLGDTQLGIGAVHILNLQPVLGLYARESVGRTVPAHCRGGSAIHRIVDCGRIAITRGNHFQTCDHSIAGGCQSDVVAIVSVIICIIETELGFVARQGRIGSAAVFRALQPDILIHIEAGHHTVGGDVAGMIRKNILQGPVASDGHHGSVLHVPAGFVIDGGPGNLSRVAGRNHGKGGGSRAKVGRGEAQDVAPDTGVAHVAYGTHPHHILGPRRKIRQHLRRNGILHIHPTIARQSVVNRQALHT